MVNKLTRRTTTETIHEIMSVVKMSRGERAKEMSERVDKPRSKRMSSGATRGNDGAKRTLVCDS